MKKNFACFSQNYFLAWRSEPLITNTILEALAISLPLTRGGGIA
jgi:hypothetical protein